MIIVHANANDHLVLISSLMVIESFVNLLPRIPMKTSTEHEVGIVLGAIIGPVSLSSS